MSQFSICTTLLHSHHSRYPVLTHPNILVQYLPNITPLTPFTISFSEPSKYTSSVPAQHHSTHTIHNILISHIQISQFSFCPKSLHSHHSQYPVLTHLNVTVQYLPNITPLTPFTISCSDPSKCPSSVFAQHHYTHTIYNNLF